MKEIDIKDFWSRVETLLCDKSLKELCDANSIEYNNLKQIKWIGKNLPKFETLHVISKYFGVSIEYLVYGTVETSEIQTIYDSMDVGKRRLLLKIAKDILET